jgi:hypothetical protein
MEKQIPTPKPVVNAFTGKCIHGKVGARFVQGRLITPSCESCMRMIHEP